MKTSLQTTRLRQDIRRLGKTQDRSSQRLEGPETHHRRLL